MFGIRSTYDLLLLATLSCIASAAWSWSDDKVKLRDVEVLTLYSGKMTTGRRSSPVPQLKCVGGSAASKFNPQVVQCYNRGFDGSDVQWECKTDMDNSFRFGTVEVICEGYDYPDDPYILKGSCGLEFTLELTKEGYEKQGQGYGHHSYTGQSKGFFGRTRSIVADILFWCMIGLLAYLLYSMCVRSSHMPGGGGGGTGWYGGGGGGTGWYGGGGGGGSGRPPPYGWRQDGYDADCGAAGGRGGGGGGNFWGGMATGGLLGYLFGRGNNNYGYGGYNRGYGTGYQGWGSSGWGGGSRGFGGGSGGFGGGSGGFGGGSGGFGGFGGGSTGTRTASGFGGTRRR